MRVHICLVSSDQGAIDFVRTKRQALIPKSLRDHSRFKDIGAEFAVSVYDPATASRGLAEYLLEGKENQFHLILNDESLGKLPAGITDACLVTEVEFTTHPKTNYANYFAGVLTRLLKNVSIFLNVMMDGGNEQVMLLPLRNFNAQQLRDLRVVCRDEVQSPQFATMVESLVEALKKRKRPHRKSNYPDQHIVDDDGKLFEYGMEQHARLATGEPHTATCVLTGNFRFGRRISTTRHYNVTKEAGKGTKISGQFSDCHDEVHTIAETTHLNIFSNDYRA